MKLRDFFVPKWAHSDPIVRQKAVENIDNVDLIRRIAEQDEHPMVRDTAKTMLIHLTGDLVRVSEYE